MRRKKIRGALQFVRKMELGYFKILLKLLGEAENLQNTDSQRPLLLERAGERRT
jgi:hypothetical protein